MKIRRHIFAGVLVFAAIAAGAFWFLRHEPDPVATAGRAAEWVPPETLVLIEVPDIGRTLPRWEGSALRQIAAADPHWLEFVLSTRNALFARTPDEGLMGALAQLTEADPATLFLAFTSLRATAPKYAGGFSYRGRKTAVHAVIAKFSAYLLQGTTEKKSEIVKHEGTEIEILNGTGFTIAFAYRDNWFFFASEVDSMKGLLQRYGAPTGTVASLATDPMFLACQKQSAPGADVVAFGHVRRLLAEAAIGTKPPDSRKNPLEAYMPEAFAYSLTIEGPLMHDQLYVHVPKLPKATPMTNRLTMFSSSETCIYGSMHLGGWEELPRLVLRYWNEEMADTARKRFEDKGVKVEELLTVFGPELSIQWDWNATDSTETFVAAIEVRDLAKARIFAEIFGGMVASPERFPKKEEGGTTFWVGERSGDLEPTLAISSRHLFAGLTRAAVDRAIQNSRKNENETGGTDIGKTPAFQDAMKPLMKPTMGTVYANFKMLSELAYARVRLGNPPDQDVKAQGVSKHLSPMGLVYGNAPAGFTIDAIGPVPALAVAHSFDLLPAWFVMPQGLPIRPVPAAK